MKKYGYVFYILLILIINSCGTPKNVAYMQDASDYGKQKTSIDYLGQIQTDDMLSIYVFSKDSALAAPFNPAAPNEGVKQYLVGPDGFIDFPIFGKVKAYGLSHMELSALLQKRLISEGYINDPSVTVKLLNFKISVMGEVLHPGVFPVPTERVTVLEAISMAGDLSIYGRRDKILVIRETGGEREMHYLNLQSTNIFSSPYYYLHQNDVVYVEPNKIKTSQSDYNPRTPVVLSAISVLISLASILLLIFKNE